MTINKNRSHWTWTPLLGCALLSCAQTAAWAQAPVTPGTLTPGTTPSTSSSSTTSTPSSTGPQTLAPSDVTNIEIPNIDPTTGLPIDSGANQVRQSITPTTPTAPVSTLPAITPQTNTGSLTAGPTVITTLSKPALSEVQTLPSANTTILGAPFGSSSFIAPGGVGVGGGVPIAGVTSSIGSGGPPQGDELGIRVGSFVLYPAIEVNAGMDSNVFAQNPALGTMIGSFYTTVSPTLALRSDWLNHAFNVAMGAQFANYVSAPTQNYQNYSLLADGRIDIRTDFYVKWAAGFVQSTEPLGTPNAAQATAPTIVNTIPVALGVFQQIGQFYYDAKVYASRQSFINNSQIGSTTLPDSSRDMTTYGESLRLGYEVTQDFRVFVQPEFNQRRYLQYINSAGQARDSDGRALNFGFDWTPSATTSFEVMGGSTGQTYYGDGSSNSAFGFGLAGTWNGYAPLSLRPSIQRSIVETSQSNYLSAVQTTYGLDYNYLIHDGWALAGGVSLTSMDYAPAPGSGAGPRTDYFFRSQVGLLYTLRPQLQIGPFFEYDSATTTDPSTGSIYDREIFSVRLIARR
jgi:hypothetical protein